MKALILLVLAPAVLGGAAGLRALPPMSVDRAAHTATLLADGRVLVAGGIRQGEAALRSGELYDPRTRRFARTGSMTIVRSGHTATLLPDGRVLVTGGWDDDDPLASAELYDPAGGRFAPTGSMSIARGGATATLLADGSVLVAGGYDGKDAVKSAELYDACTGSFTAVGSMELPRSSHTATRLADGRVLVAGGSSRAGVLAAAEIYEPAARSFAPAGAMAVPRHKHGAVLLRDGRVLIVGGSDERDWEGRYRSAELFDPGTGRFTPTGSMRAPRFKLADAITTLPGERVLVAGGGTLAEVYRGGRFVPAGRFDAARYFATATRLLDGSVLIAGGYDRAIRPAARAWLYRPGAPPR